MDEAKSLVHMALTAMYAAMILMAASALIGLGYLMWSAFSDQDATNKRMQEYAKYAAFDNTTVRGQDVVSLLHDTQGDPFIIVVSPAQFNDLTVNTDWKTKQNSDIDGTGMYPVLVAYNSALAPEISLASGSEYRLSATGKESAWNIDKSIEDILRGVGDYGLRGEARVSVESPIEESHVDNKYLTMRINYAQVDNPIDYTTLQNFFLERGFHVSDAFRNIGDGEKEKAEACYLQYQSFIVYDAVTEGVAGLVLVESTENRSYETSGST